MVLSSYDYLMPLLEAHKDGRWGKAGPSTPQMPYYVALETLAQERGLPFRRVKLAAPYYPNHGHILKEAIIPAMVLFQGDTPILRDLHGNETPMRVIKAFAKAHDLKMELSKDLKNIDAWKDADPRPYGRNSPSQTRLEAIINSGRAIVLALHMEQTAQVESAKTPIRRM